MINKNVTTIGRAVEQQLVQSSKKGTDGIQIVFRIEDGEFNGQTVRFDGWFPAGDDEKAQKVSTRVIESMQHCGWEGEDLEEFADRKLHGLDKNKVELVIEMEEYEGDDEKYKGKKFPRVRWVNSIGGRGLNVEQAMTPEKAASFGARLKGLVVKSKLARQQVANGGNGTDFDYGANAPVPPAAAGGGGTGHKRF